MPHYQSGFGRQLGGLVVLLLACQVMSPARADDIPGLPGWKSLDIGTSLPGYFIVQPDGTWSIAGSGADIGKLGDAFRYTYMPATGDFSLTCRVTHQTNTDPSAKIGVMIRDTLDPGSRHFMLVRMPGNGVDPMWRVEMSQQTLDFKPKAYSGTLPVWLRVQRTGSLFMAFGSRDGTTWKQIGPVVQISMGAQVLAGICLTAHNDDQICLAEVDHVSVSPDVVVLGPDHLQGFPGPHSALLTWYGIPNAKGYNVYRQSPNGPVKLNSQPLANWFYVDPGDTPDGLPDNQPQQYQVTAVLDRGESLPSAAAVVTPMQPIGGQFMGYNMNTASPGHAAFDPTSGMLDVDGSGSDIFDTFDRMYFLAAPARGATELTARILARPQRTDPSAKAGLMIRETLEDSARNVFLCATPDHGLFAQWRHDPRGGTASSGSETVSTYPIFLRIRRLGDLINCFRSDDGTSYDRVGTTVKLDNLSPDVFIGFAITAHHEGSLTHADFDRIVVR
jgi:hypothetical protein